MNQRKAFIDAVMPRDASISALCRQFRISQKTGCEWIGRFLGGCELGDRSRRPRHSPRAVAAAVEDAMRCGRLVVLPLPSGSVVRADLESLYRRHTSVL